MNNKTLLLFATAVLSTACIGTLAVVWKPTTGSAAPEPQPASEQPTFVTLRGMVREFQSSPHLHPDFGSPDVQGPYACYVEATLDNDLKPVYQAGTGRRISREWRDAANRKIAWCLYDPDRGDQEGSFGNSSDGAIASIETFSQWFRDTPGVNLSTIWDIELELVTSGAYAGSYAFETNDLHPFHSSSDDRFGSGSERDRYFTLEVAASFVYDPDAAQFLRFKGDDDTWVFIDGKLVVDHGGIAGSRDYFVEFDRLGLAAGESYDIRLFHAERKQPQSQFHLWTNVVLDQDNSPVGTISATFD